MSYLSQRWPQCVLIGTFALMSLSINSARAQSTGLTSHAVGYAAGGGAAGIGGGLSSGGGLGGGAAAGGLPGLTSNAMPGATGGGAQASFGASGVGGMSSGAGSTPYGSSPKKAAPALKKVKSTSTPAVPNKDANYNWGGSNNTASTSLYVSPWARPTTDYSWGATPR